MSVTYVENDELLYRAVRGKSDEYRIEDGRLRFTVNAFGDQACKPSVDRSGLREDPRDTCFADTDGVTSIVTSEVRAIATVKVNGPDGNPKIDYKVDVHHRPIEKSEARPQGNPAHCQIECDPEIARNHCKKLKEALAILATKRGWAVPPPA
jgi:hypothetical protein